MLVIESHSHINVLLKVYMYGTWGREKKNNKDRQIDRQTRSCDRFEVGEPALRILSFYLGISDKGGIFQFKKKISLDDVDL